jgi:hypothetical protein
MNVFCPDGYVPTQLAIERASLCWFPEHMTAFKSAAAGELAIDRANDDVNGLTPVEKLARLRKEIVGVTIETEHRLRNFLHQGVLTAYYFGTLFGQGRYAVAREFWATTEADGVLISGIYWPFGQPRAWQERPGYPLFVLEPELAELLGDEPKPSPSNLNVNEVVGGARREDPDQRAAADSEAESGHGAKSRGIVEAIKKLWPDGIPNGLSAKGRDRAIVECLKAAGDSVPIDPARAIQRALKAKRDNPTI